MIPKRVTTLLTSLICSYKSKLSGERTLQPAGFAPNMTPRDLGRIMGQWQISD